MKSIIFVSFIKTSSYLHMHHLASGINFLIHFTSVIQSPLHFTDLSSSLLLQLSLAIKLSSEHTRVTDPHYALLVCYFPDDFMNFAIVL